MVRNDSFNTVLKMKKGRAIKTIYLICNRRGLKVPNINFEGCPEERQDHLAHYHPDTKTICISDRQLTMLNFEDIESTMAHEVSHILVGDHGPKFSEEEATSRVAGLEIPSGVVVHHPNQNSYKQSKKPTKPKKPNNKICNAGGYNHRIKKGLRFCGWCKPPKKYCAEHVRPQDPHGRADSIDTMPGHRCPDYIDFLDKKEKRQTKRFVKALDKIKQVDRRVVSSTPKLINKKSEDERLKEYIKKNTEDEILKDKFRRAKAEFKLLKEFEEAEKARLKAKNEMINTQKPKQENVIEKQKLMQFKSKKIKQKKGVIKSIFDKIKLLFKHKKMNQTKFLEFYDIKYHKKFRTNNYKVVTRMVKGNKRKFAVAIAPSGIEAWKIFGKGVSKRMKNKLELDECIYD